MPIASIINDSGVRISVTPPAWNVELTRGWLLRAKHADGMLDSPNSTTATAAAEARAERQLLAKRTFAETVTSAKCQNAT